MFPPKSFFCEMEGFVSQVYLFLLGPDKKFHFFLKKLLIFKSTARKIEQLGEFEVSIQKSMAIKSLNN